MQLLQTADVVLYDRLVSDDILRLVHSGARMVYVGKQKGLHTRTQEEIHELLLQFAGAGATVVRLKGGDPYVFGRGGEELEYLEANGIRQELAREAVPLHWTPDHQPLGNPTKQGPLRPGHHGCIRHLCRAGHPHDPPGPGHQREVPHRACT